jgi:hypothetical protein
MEPFILPADGTYPPLPFDNLLQLDATGEPPTEVVNVLLDVKEASDLLSFPEIDPVAVSQILGKLYEVRIVFSGIATVIQVYLRPEDTASKIPYRIREQDSMHHVLRRNPGTEFLLDNMAPWDVHLRPQKGKTSRKLKVNAIISDQSDFDFLLLSSRKKKILVRCKEIHDTEYRIMTICVGFQTKAYTLVYDIIHVGDYEARHGLKTGTVFPNPGSYQIAFFDEQRRPITLNQDIGVKEVVDKNYYIDFTYVSAMPESPPNLIESLAAQLRAFGLE